MPTSEPPSVFIYGTLKRDLPNHHLMPEASFKGTARTSDRIPLVVAGRWFTPILIAESGGHRVTGELYGVDDAGLAYLDNLEGVGREFGFDRIQMNPSTSFTTSTVGFENDDTRKKVFDKYEEFKSREGDS